MPGVRHRETMSGSLPIGTRRDDERTCGWCGNKGAWPRKTPNGKVYTCSDCHEDPLLRASSNAIKRKPSRRKEVA